MIRKYAIILFLTTIVILSEQKPTLQNRESNQLEEIQPVRTINDEDALTTPMDSPSTVIDDTTKAEESFTTLPDRGFDAFGFFLKIVTRRVGNIEKRSVLSENEQPDLDTAANTVFRPLFAYRKQNSQRRRLRRF